jgi:DNA-binding NtrC family response regulator
MQILGDMTTVVRSSFPEPADLTPLRILVVDDWPHIGDLLRLVLMRVEHAVEVVASPEEALAKLERSDYDVVISELYLCRDINALELCRVIRHRWPWTAFILATASMASISSSCIDAILLKPFGVRMLRESVVRVAATRARVQEQSRGI